MSNIIVTAVSKKEIEQLIGEAVQKAILGKQKDEGAKNVSFLDVNQAAEFLGIAKATLYGKCCHQLIPHFKKGKKLYFDKIELLEWLKSGKRKTVADIDKEVKTQLMQRNSSVAGKRISTIK